MKTEAISKINKVGKIGQVICNICKVFLGIGIAATLAASIVLAVMPKDFIQMDVVGSTRIDVNMEAIGRELTAEQEREITNGADQGLSGVVFQEGSFGYEISDVSASDNHIYVENEASTLQAYSIHDMVYVTISAFFYAIAAMVSLVFAGRLCKAFAVCGSPFDMDVIGKMRAFAFSIIPWVVLDNLVGNVSRAVFAGKNSTYHVSVDLTMLALVLVLFALTYIFRYGAMLQQESDETL